MADVVCYGVQIPGSEGRAGMVAVGDADDSINLQAFIEEAKLCLPGYAVPLFVRKLRQLDRTGEFPRPGGRAVLSGCPFHLQVTFMSTLLSIYAISSIAL